MKEDGLHRQYNTVQYLTMAKTTDNLLSTYSTVQYSTVHTVPYSTYSTVHTVPYRIVQYSAVPRVQCSSVQYL